jgi:hypothetical protein
VRCETEAEAKAEKDGKIRAHQLVRRETEAEAKKKKKSCMQAHGKIRAHQRVRREKEAEALPERKKMENPCARSSKQDAKKLAAFGERRSSARCWATAQRFNWNCCAVAQLEEKIIIKRLVGGSKEGEEIS